MRLRERRDRAAVSRRCQPLLDALEQRLALSTTTPGPAPPKGGGAGSSSNQNQPAYPFTSSNPLTSVAFNESDVLRAANLNVANGTFDVWYNDEHALALGVREVIVKTASGTTVTNYPLSTMNGDPSAVQNPSVGDPAGTDPSGRPMAPSLYITDITNNPGSTSGDWQYGGTGIAPSAVYGSWKGFVQTINETGKTPTVTLTADKDPTKNNWNLGPGADAAPSALKSEGYGAEVQFNLNQLYTQGLLVPGHTYRFYVMVHDGDQNKAGGDAGQAVYNYYYPGPTPGTPGPGATLSGYVSGVGGTPLASVVVTLTGTDANGNAVDLTATTDANGFYNFTGLSAGTYVVDEPLPGGGPNFNITNPGTVNGTTDGVVDSSGDIGQILLQAGDNGVQYDFGQVFVPA